MEWVWTQKARKHLFLPSLSLALRHTLESHAVLGALAQLTKAKVRLKIAANTHFHPRTLLCAGKHWTFLLIGIIYLSHEECEGRGLNVLPREVFAVTAKWTYKFGKKCIIWEGEGPSFCNPFSKEEDRKRRREKRNWKKEEMKKKRRTDKGGYWDRGRERQQRAHV